MADRESQLEDLRAELEAAQAEQEEVQAEGRALVSSASQIQRERDALIAGAQEQLDTLQVSSSLKNWAHKGACMEPGEEHVWRVP